MGKLIWVPVLLIMSAIYVAPHLSKRVGWTWGIIFLIGSLMVGAW